MEQKIKQILFELVGQSRLHPITEKNFILEVDYEKYTQELLALFAEEAMAKSDEGSSAYDQPSD